MKFNIKDWQDKHLIRESKGLKREIDFKNQDAFKKYNTKHKMRKTTKVNIAGKDTTAGDASGDGKSAKQSYTAGQRIGSDHLSDILTGMDGDASGYYDDGGQTGLIDHMEKAFDKAGLFDYPDGPDGERDMGVTYQGISDAIDAYDGLENETNPDTGEKWTPEDIEADKEYFKSEMRDALEVEEESSDTSASSKSGTAPVNGKSLSDLVNNSLDDFDGEDYEEEAMERLDQLFQDTGAYDKEELTYEDGMKAIQDLDNYLDGEGIHNDEDEAYDAKLEMQDQLQKLFDTPEGGWTDDNKGNVKADGSSHDYGELDRTTKSSQTGRFDDDDDDDDDYDDGDGDDYDDDGFTDEDKLLNGLDAFRDGLIDKDEWDDIRDDYDEDGEYSDEDGYGEEQAPKAPKEKEFDGKYDGKKYIDPNELNADNVGDYDKSWAGEFTDNQSETYSKDTARLIMRGFAWNDKVDGKDFKANFNKDGSVSIKALNDRTKFTDSMNDPYKTVYDEDPSKYSRLPKKSVTSGERKYTGNYSKDHGQGENFDDGFFDDVKKELGQTYNLDKKTTRKVKNDLYYIANARFAQAAEEKIRAGEEPPTKTARDFALEIEKVLNNQNKVKDGVTLVSKNESATPRSARIQEARMYRTIQELKGLEKK